MIIMICQANGTQKRGVANLRYCIWIVLEKLQKPQKFQI
jgi:hypothetical protein